MLLQDNIHKVFDYPYSFHLNLETNNFLQISAKSMKQVPTGSLPLRFCHVLNQSRNAHKKVKNTSLRPKLVMLRKRRALRRSCFI